MHTTIGRSHGDQLNAGGRWTYITMWRGSIGCLIILALGSLAAPFSSDAQPSAKVASIGFLSLFGDSQSPAIKAFRQGLHERGYVEGQNIVIEDRWAEGNYHRLAEFAAELVRLKVDVIVALRTLAIRAAITATTAIPIVMVAAGDPVSTGLITSLARPGGNITGLATLTTELSGKRLELLKEAIPTLSHVAVLWNSAAWAKMMGITYPLLSDIRRQTAKAYGVLYDDPKLVEDPATIRRFIRAKWL